MWMARRAPKKLDAINVGCALLFLYSDLPYFFWMTFLLHPPNALVFLRPRLFCFLHTFFTRKGFFVSRSLSELFLRSFFLVLRWCPPSFFPPPLLLLCRLLLVLANDKYNGFGQGSVDVFG